ncbi:MAG: hypothetical protein JXQ80_03905 [Bacteroidales bacterium]|nr:hypothetical protein [Bacteroidales bacterium]
MRILSRFLIQIRMVIDNTSKWRVAAIGYNRTACFATLMLICTTYICTGTIIAQEVRRDSLDLIEQLVEKKDTLVKSDLPSPLVKTWLEIRDRPIDSVLLLNENSRIIRELHSLLFNRAVPKSLSPANNAIMASMDGCIIRNIEFENVNLFAPSVLDTGYVSAKNLERSVESVHKGTRNRVLERYLLFQPGDRLDVFVVAENERMLRELSFIMDAGFIAKRVPGSSDSVDLLLVTQDIIPLGIELEIVSSSQINLGISHHNVLGRGNRITATSYWDAAHHPHLGYRLAYGMENVAGTYARGSADYIHKWNQETLAMGLSRDFRTSSFRNAGGMNFENTSAIRNIELLDTTLSDVSLAYNTIDFWAGHFLPLHKPGDGFFLTGRLNQFEISTGPVTNEQYLYAFQDHTLLLFSTGFSHQGFRKDNLIHTFGRTEDVPYGYLVNFTAGVEWGEYKTRSYFAVGGSFGSYFNNGAHLSGQLGFGTFLNQNQTEQGTFSSRLQFFSTLHRQKRFQYRNFVKLTYLDGIERYQGEYTTIAGKEGITGLTDSYLLRGSKKLVLNFESVFFSPYKLLGFRFAFFGGIDLALVAGENDRIEESDLYSGVSVGVRVRNDQLVFDTFVLRLGIYPGKPGDANASNLIIDGIPKERFNGLFPQKPTLVPFQ